MAFAPLYAQVPNGSRRVHPSIADALPGVSIPSSPHMAVRDGKWNNGEGFTSGSQPSGPNSPIDHGGWFEREDGTDVTAADVHAWSGWTPWLNYTFTDNLPSMYPTVNTRRFVGYLRPQAAGPLPMTHPLYGPVGAHLPNGYVDQAAFEAFCPTTPWTANKKVVIVLHVRETFPFPKDFASKSRVWGQTYCGFFSPDGLARDEQPATVRGTALEFANNNDPDAVNRPSLELLGSWNPASDYWPILVHATLTVPGRSATLNEQRQMQAAQAVKTLLQLSNDSRNPLGMLAPSQLPDEVSDVVLVLVGGSNGGHQSHWAALRFPSLVHGCFAEVISPSIQRLYGEHDLGHSLARLSGNGFHGATVREGDHLLWNQYAWSEGLQVHDLSYPRQFASGHSYRPACFIVGDEDITSTGTDWVRTISGGGWQDHGITTSTSSYGDPNFNTLAWMVVENGCHQNSLVPANDPYQQGAPTWGSTNVAHGLIQHAIEQREAEILNPGPAPALVPTIRNAAQQFRGLDDPQEWALGRHLDEMPVTTSLDLLERDVAFSANDVQIDSAGTMPGGKEAMLIRDGFLFVGCAEGIVSKFYVDQSLPGMPLRRAARSVKLGNDAFALTAVGTSGGWSLIVGTRRHLYRLDPVSLSIQAGPVLLPWEVAQPRHMEVGDVLSTSGQELIFHSVHGGLVFYDPINLTPIHEWPEPGIIDFALTGPMVTLLSARGVVANVYFSGSAHGPVLDAASQSIPVNWTSDLPCQGQPSEMELMRVDWGTAGTNLAVISAWTGDLDGPTAIRAHWQTTMQRQPFLFGANDAKDIATCTEDVVYGQVGDHLLLLLGDNLWLIDQFAHVVGCRNLLTTASGVLYPFGANSHTLAVGELVPTPGNGYQEEVVIATTTGLVWMHVQDLVVPGHSWPPSDNHIGSPLPATFDPVIGSAFQPHTNRTTAAVTAIVAGGPNNTLDVLDVRGVHWRVAADGSMVMNSVATILGTPVLHARNWSRFGVPQSSSIGLPWSLFNPLTPDAVATFPWCAIKSHLVVYEQAPASQIPDYEHDNWRRRLTLTAVHAGFIVHPAGGWVNDSSFSGGGVTDKEAWSWTAPPAIEDDEGDWGNVIEGIRVSSTGVINGVWASSADDPQGAGVTADKLDYHDLRTFSTGQVVMTQQAIRSVRMGPVGQEETYLVLGCPGGRVRIVKPGAMRPDDNTPFSIGDRLGNSSDLGFGGCALAVKVIDPDLVKIWFGSISNPAPKPQNYANPGSVLADHEVATGAVHVLTFRPSTGVLSLITSTVLTPNGANARGGYGVVGLRLGDLVTTLVGDELVVATLSGDILVLRADSLTHIASTHVNGMVGHYNSIAIEDLDGDQQPELYLGGSWGLWRFFVNSQVVQ